MESRDTPREVFSGTIIEAEMIKSFLLDAGIEGYLFDSFIGSIAPWYTAGGGAGAVRLMVSAEDYEAALLIVAKYQERGR